MQITHEREQEVTVLTLSGRLDTQYASDFETTILDHIGQGARFFLIDCSAVDYMNSAGLKVLLLAAKKLETDGGRIVLCGLMPNVKTVFELTGFDKLFEIRPTRGEARSIFG